MPVSEAPMNSAYEFIGYTDGSASRLNSQKASQGDVDEKKVDELYEADLNSSDDEYPDPQQFLADRSTQPEKKPATSKIDEKISPPPPKANGSSSNSANAKAKANAGFDLATANPSTHDDTDGQGVSKAPSVGSPPVRTESASPWEGLGKRRRAAGHNSEYDQRPVPVIVGQSNRSLTSTREQPEQIRTPSPAGEKQAPSHTSDMTTPAKGKGRLKIRVKPFSATKKIRMSASESPVRKELDSSEQISKSPYKAVLPDNRNDHGTGAKAHEDSSDGVGDARPLDSRPSSSPVMLAPPTFSLPEASSSAPLPSSIPTSNPISHVSESSPATQPKTTEADLVSDIDIPSPKSTPDPRSSPQRSQDSTSGKEQESESDTRSSGSELSTQGKRHARRSTRLKRKSPEPSTKAPPSQPTRSRMARRSGGRPAARPAAVKQRTTQSWVSTARAAKETAKARIAKAAMPTIEPDTSSYESSATDNTQETAEQPLHRVSSQRRVSMCQRLLQLHQAQENSVGLGIQLTPDVLKTSSLLDPDALQNIRTPTTRSPPSPSRRATLSGTMRVFGDWEPSINDKDRLLYMRRLKGLMEGTRLAAREALRVLYFCTGDWVSARRFITAGPSAMPPGRMWTAKEDEVLLKGMNPETMEHLRETKGSTEVYRRLQFLNTFHGIQPQ
ncbi:hypothetical protein GGI12_004476 [Dipsacomyces acuminosporus]|nr:hypothetical protein GGI12_004476 [Dipsacomyces acuminosporus]